MKIVQTLISETSILVRYADESDPAKAQSWMEFSFPLAHLARPNTGGTTLGDLELRLLEEIHGAVLLHARNAIDIEIARLQQIGGR
jgi:hypothetical protein